LQHVWLKSKKTVVFVTHDVREALVLADRVVVMAGRPGRILRDLEVRLKRPRDPDDDVLVHLSRQIRDALRRAEAAGDRAAHLRARPVRQGEGDEQIGASVSAVDVPGDPPAPVGPAL
jgi:ABC-type proline/glycine betaine transport system ATPase subunit